MSGSALGKTRRPRRSRASHVTLADVARTARVAKSSASYALNGRPGVAEATRERILAVADAMGWLPNSAARALSVCRANAIGLVLAQPAEALAFDTFHLRFIAGLEQELSRHDLALLLRVVSDPGEEAAVHRRWFAEHRVDGVILVNVRIRDQRAALLRRLGLPAVTVGAPGGGTSAVWSDDVAAMRTAVEYLVSLGHRRVARVGGNPEFRYTQLRREAFLAAARGSDLKPEDILDIGLTGDQATSVLLDSSPRPTAIIYEDDANAVSAVTVARRMGVSVPGDLSIVGWDDSRLCELVHPQLTALHRDIFRYGELCARHLVGVIEGNPPGDLQGTATTLVIRGSTGPPAAALNDCDRAGSAPGG
jgi:DNA-binding LacI/PurR family transcriptional regulator